MPVYVIFTFKISMSQKAENSIYRVVLADLLWVCPREINPMR